MKRLILCSILVMATLAACEGSPTSDDKQQAQQEKILDQGTSQVGMPNIVNFQRRKLMKQIYEMLDQEGLVTYTYLEAEMPGQVGDKLCTSIGYPLPVAMQFTNPMKIAYHSSQVGVLSLPQADPDGLFSPSSAEGSWVVCQNPHKPEQTGVVYSEPRLIVSPFPLK